MRQLILVTKNHTSNVTDKGTLTTINKTGQDFFQLIAGRGVDVNPDTFVVYKKDLRWTKGTTVVGKKFKATISPQSAVKNVSYGLSIVKSGTVFNERNSWITTVEASDKFNSAADIATQLAKQLGAMSETTGLKVSVVSATITIEASEPGVDYIITTICDKPTDMKETVQGLLYNVSQEAVTGKYDAKWLKDAIASSMAERGIDSTHVDAMTDTTNFYSNFEIPAVTEDDDLTVYTLSFYNPRFDHNIDEHLTQKIQVVFAKDAATDKAAFETLIADKDARNKQEDDTTE